MVIQWGFLDMQEYLNANGAPKGSNTFNYLLFHDAF